MPPEGHTSVTLPNELVAQIDDHAKAVGASSRADAIRSLMAGYDSTVAARIVEFDDDAAERLATDRQGQLEETINGMCGDHATEEAVGELAREVRKAQELAEQARDAAQRVEAEIPEQ